jgi:putative SOS response-associated peptidase YedK
MFRKLIRERRCLIPSNCYYEWKQTLIGKTSYCIRMADESPFFLGGMWDVWHAREPEALINPPTDRVRDHPVRRTRSKDVPDIRISSIQPTGVVLRLDDQRHAVVDRR